MENRNLLIIFVVIILVIVGIGYYVIKTKNNEIKQLNSNLNSLRYENSKLKLNINALNKEVGIFIEGCGYLKAGCDAVRSIKAKEFLKSHRIEETYLGFNQLPSEDTIESLYKSGNENVKSTIKQNCPEAYYIPSIQGREERTREPKLVVKESFPHVLITDRDADITSNSWRQKVFIFFNETYDIVCAWKIDMTKKVPAEVYTPLK